MAIGAASMLLLVSLVLGAFGPGIFAPKHAEALDGGGSLTLALKETVLDAIAFALINMVLQGMTKDIVSWINSGFNGSPAFMQDFGGFLTGVSDKVVGDFIWNNETTRFLCSPFRLDIQFALNIQYKKSRNYGSVGSQCTLTGVTRNLENFFNGRSLAGGWDTWFKVTQDPQYNPYGALLVAQEQMSVRLANSRGQEAKLLDWGKGFLSVKQCKDVAYPDGVVDKKCDTVTPGTAIESQLNATLDSGRQRVQVADEINEIIGALFTQLAKQAISGAGGLLGLSGGGRAPSGPAYYDEGGVGRAGGGATTGSTYLTNMMDQPSGVAIPANQNPIRRSLTLENEYLSAEQSIVSNITDASTYKVTIYGPSDTCHSGLLTPQLQTELNLARIEVSAANTNVTTLDSLLTQYDTAANKPNGAAIQNDVFQQYFTLSLHTNADLDTVNGTTTPRVSNLVETLERQIDSACEQPLNG